MEKRLLFYGVDILGNQLTINQAVKFAGLVFAHPAKSPFTILDMAVMVAKTTENCQFLFLIIKQSFFHKSPPGKDGGAAD